MFGNYYVHMKLIESCEIYNKKINHLKSAIPASSKDRLYEVVNLSEAWSILDQVYSQKFDMRKNQNLS